MAIKILGPVLAGAGLLVAAGAVSAQIVATQPAAPGPAGPRIAPGHAAAPAPPPWMRDDGSSSDYPVHTATDFTADGLNRQYRNGFTIIGPVEGR